MKHYLALVLLLCLLVGCGAEPTPTPDAVATQIAVEESAHATMTAQAPTTTDTPEPTDTATTTPTDTPKPTDTRTPTRTPRPTITPKPTVTPIAWERFVSKEYRLAFDYPARLTVEQRAKQSWQVVDGEESRFVVISVMDEPSDDWLDLSLEELTALFLSLLLKQLDMSLDDLELVSAQETSDYGAPGILARYDSTDGSVASEILVVRSPSNIWIFWFVGTSLGGWLEQTKASVVLGTQLEEVPAGAETPEPTDTMGPTEPPEPTKPPPTEPPKPSATSKPKPTVPLPSTVELRRVTDYATSIGTHNIVGEVVNGTGQNLEFVEVVASLYDADGKLVGSEFTFTLLDIVEDGGTSPFLVSILDPPASMESYELQLQYDTTTEQPLEVEILSHQGSMSSIGTYNITGEVKNPYDFGLEYVEIIGTFYNGAGDVVRAEFTFSSLDELDPGQTSPFELTVIDPAEDMADYKLQTQALRR